MSYDRGKCERLMTVCQKGYPASNIHVEYANNTLAECYGVIGAMMIEIDQLQKDADRYQQIKLGAHKEDRDGGYTGFWQLPNMPGWDDTPYSHARKEGYSYRDSLDDSVDSVIRRNIK